MKRVLSIARRLWTFPYRRHVRRAHARWRLHRIEWNGRHRPLDPPKGYEKYYTAEEMFPGLRDKETWKPKTFREHLHRLHIAWRLYRHQYTGADEEMERFQNYIFKPFRTPEEQEEIENKLKNKKNNVDDKSIVATDDDDHRTEEEKEEFNRKEFDRKVEESDKQVDQFLDRADQLGSHLKQSSQTAYENIKKHTPHAQTIVTNRAQIAKDAVEQLVQGYHEGVNGKVTWASIGLDFTDPTIRSRWLDDDEREEEEVRKRSEKRMEFVAKHLQDYDDDDDENKHDEDFDPDNPPIVYLAVHSDSVDINKHDSTTH